MVVTHKTTQVDITRNVLQSMSLQNISQGNHYIKQLIKRGQVIEAHQIFQKMAARDVYSWTALLSGYVNCGKADEALHLFCHMQKESVLPNNVTFICALKACVVSLSLDWGRKIHAFIMEIGLELDMFVGSCLVDMYAKCGSIYDAAQVFSKLPVRNVVSWTTLISGYVKEGLGAAALEHFWQMQHEKVAPNEVTLASNLAACGLIPSLEKGQEIHQFVVCCGFELDYVVGNSLIGMYMKCGGIEDARHAFDRIEKEDLIPWNTMIEGYTQHGMGREAMHLFQRMIEKGVTPDRLTFLSSLKACAQLQDREKGKHVYACIKSSNVEVDVILGSSLIDMFAKCGCIESAHSAFNLLRKRDVITWTIMISALLQYGDTEEAFTLFEEMQQARVLPDKLTYNNMINACARISDFEKGKRLHSEIIANGLQLDVVVGSSLVDMYAKCGDLDKAQEVFSALSERDIVAWNAMIVGYAQHGDFKGLYGLFRQMHKSVVKLDSVTYLSILSALNHWGLVDEGHCLMDAMAKDQGIKPTSEHCNCMVDLLGRAGHLKDAEELVRKMPFQPSAADWMSLLGACRLYHNVDIAKDAIGTVEELEPNNATAFVLFSNTFGEFED